MAHDKPSAPLFHQRKYEAAVFTVTATVIRDVDGGAGRVLVKTRDETGRMLDEHQQTLSDVAANGIAMPNPVNLAK